MIHVFSIEIECYGGGGGDGGGVVNTSDTWLTLTMADNILCDLIMSQHCTLYTLLSDVCKLLSAPHSYSQILLSNKSSPDQPSPIWLLFSFFLLVKDL